jgi:hypothetical protein
VLKLRNVALHLLLWQTQLMSIAMEPCNVNFFIIAEACVERGLTSVESLIRSEVAVSSIAGFLWPCDVI